MHPSTEDLLSVRDGEPLDAARATACERPEHAPELHRLAKIRDALRALPEIEPPKGVWERAVEAEMRSRRPKRPRMYAAVAIAATIAAVAVLLIANPTRAPDIDSTPLVTTQPTWRSSSELRTPTPTYVSLVQESARLDRVLSQISYQRPVMTAGTAGTIVLLEDRIGFIDEQMNYGNARGMQPRQREALLSERVDLMNALVHVRLAQSQQPGF